ncbi:NADH dehydrogenase [ubiquinone] 1 alpha subcomplex subunit 13 [Cryptotermes secundus]|uniref:NADH dehydrogenase [ubiquinone] 1 alpha subcomplex subunit 13 n=1 Tax=Cryptotermes secundus TaxID=105785 RepID=UPI000CD7B76D|nr:NADH dehydrogenase [ubiquinone] 1 alpha subcomplex subunit 13 [Cryptotermes secundus]
MATAAKHQDMPPEGGYNPINYARIPAKKYFSGSTMILGYLAVTAVSGYVYYLTWKKVRQDQIEMRSARLALQPLLTAERDREFLNQLRRNRDEEAKLMANVPGWEVGTWYGEPVYKTLPPDTLVTPYIYEFYAHASDSEFKRRTTLVLWS